MRQALTRPLAGSSSIDEKDVVAVQGTFAGGRSSVKVYFDQ